MTAIFYIAAAIALISTVLVITRTNAVHALLYLVVSFLAISVIFYILGAPFIAALEVIIYAGAIMVLFIFVMMMLNMGEKAARQERQWLQPGMFIAPSIMSLILAALFLYILLTGPRVATEGGIIGPREVGISLFSTYLLGVELAGMLLLAGLVGAFHLGRRHKSDYGFRRPEDKGVHETDISKAKGERVE
jgi:NADH-quinone oxidoreductase subunit J